MKLRTVPGTHCGGFIYYFFNVKMFVTYPRPVHCKTEERNSDLELKLIIKIIFQNSFLAVETLVWQKSS